MITVRVNELNESAFQVVRDRSDLYKQLTNQAAAFKIERIGWALDVAGGTVVDFPEQRFNFSKISRAGAWLTGGYEGGSRKPSALAILRYMYQPARIFADDAGILNTADISSFDAGARMLFKGSNGRFILSLEALYRSVLNKNTINPSWRFVGNAEYDIGFNKKLTISNAEVICFWYKKYGLRTMNFTDKFLKFN
jgi:hypothetical protein